MSLTILIPCYNNAPYLEESITSLLNQTVWCDDSFSIIAINDGSKDNTLEILKKFEASLKNFIVINKENTGYGDSLNIAIKRVESEYVGILEPDDLAFAKGFSTLLLKAKKYKLDICRGYFVSFNETREWICKKKWIPNNKIFSCEDIPEVFVGGPSIWCAIYRTQFLRDNKIDFLTTPGASFQDTSFAFKCYLKASRIMFLDVPVIKYRTDNANSSVNSKDKVSFLCQEWEEIINFCGRQKSDSSLIRRLLPIIQNGSYQWNLDRLDRKHKEGFIKLWSKEMKKFIKNGDVRLKWLPLSLWFKFYLLAEFPFLFVLLRKQLGFQTDHTSLKKIRN